MSLTQNDLQEIRSIVKAEVEPLTGEVKALRNDIKEIYDMISQLQYARVKDKEFMKRSLEEKLLTLNTELLAAAKQAGITLPRQ